MVEPSANEDQEIEEFLALSSAKESSQSTYRSQLTELRRRLGKPLKSANLADLGRLKRGLHSDGRRSAPYYIRTLRGFYLRSGLKELAEACRDRIKTVRLAPDDVLTAAEVTRIIEAASSKRDAALIGALWDTGGRVSELIALDLKDVRTEAGSEPPRYTLWFHTVKGDSEQHEGYILDTSTTFRIWLKAHPSRVPSAPVFCASDGRRMGRKRAWSMVGQTARRAGITKHVHPHLFRHSRATHLLRLGVSEANVKKLLGWSPGSQQLTRYSHLSSRDAFRSLVAANGGTVPPEEKVGRVQVDVEKLVPVVPVPTSNSEKVTTETFTPAQVRESMAWAKANEEMVRRVMEQAMEEFKRQYLGAADAISPEPASESGSRPGDPIHDSGPAASGLPRGRRAGPSTPR